MSSKQRWVLGVIVSFIVGAAGGGYLVHLSTMRLLMDSAIDIDAYSLRVYTSALEDLRTGNPEASMERLEAWMDLTLIRAMEPSNYDIRIRDITLARADSAFHEVRGYRETYPRISGTAGDPMVAAVWSAGPPSQFR